MAKMKDGDNGRWVSIGMGGMQEDEYRYPSEDWERRYEKERRDPVEQIASRLYQVERDLREADNNAQAAMSAATTVRAIADDLKKTIHGMEERMQAFMKQMEDRMRAQDERVEKAEIIANGGGW